MRRLATGTALLIPGPALAATGPFFSLNNTDFVVLLGFLVFIGILLWYRVPGTVGKMLDNRAEGIRSDLAEARELREEAQTLLATYERKQKDVQDQADRIVSAARKDAQASADKALADMEAALERRKRAAQEQIASAEEQAVRDVRNRAVDVAIAAARDVLIRQMDAERQNRLIDESISTVDAKLH
ncbi:F-type H+-transporting ATPase subunit b [Palleronia aestuarii]|uniref:ATP synthase subunit b n=1 Tax=Palleronia aestuarii TaxID=568105 RepID=A0A2W7NC59_9RHOB|nr:F0F1 ATP synthase subunit B [Palleronia aestuarii]PZX15747.1 F-type H+-transporting ATPase subunit b [Palleronia aestuarii]